MLKTSITRSIEEIIILTSTIIMAVTITPLAIYRYFNGQQFAATIELFGVVFLCGIAAYVWKTRKTRIMSAVLSVFLLAGLVTVNYLLGTSILFWIYPIIMTVYLINSLKLSVIFISPAIIALLPLLMREKAIIEVCSIFATLIICQIIGYLLTKKIRQQYSIMESLANQDGLTSTFNRRAFDDRIHFIRNFSMRYDNKNESTASLIMFDIDNFKQINDTQGHREGDQILINLSKLFQKQIRGIDQLYRFGGEEFMIIVNGADVFKATELAERMRKILEESSVSTFTKVTASFGVAEYNHPESTSSWINRVDKAMYRAKRAGKNRVYIANTDEQASQTHALKSVNS